jgi:hypothetical protein
VKTPPSHPSLNRRREEAENILKMDKCEHEKRELTEYLEEHGEEFDLMHADTTRSRRIPSNCDDKKTIKNKQNQFVDEPD